MRSKTEILDEVLHDLAGEDQEKYEVLTELFELRSVEAAEIDMWTPERPPIVMRGPDPVVVVKAHLERLQGRLADPDDPAPNSEIERLIAIAEQDLARLEGV